MKTLDTIERYNHAYPFESDGGDAFIVKFDDRGSDRFLAFSNVCTHMGCRLIRVKEGEESVTLLEDDSGRPLCGPCPCHGTSFDLSKEGIVVLGPATHHLPEMRIDIRDGVAHFDGWLRGPPPGDSPWSAGAPEANA